MTVYPDAPWLLPQPESRPLGVVIPTLNCASTLAETLLSVASVSVTSRVIVADSGSTDGTLEIAARAGVEVLENLPLGMYAAINAAIARLNTPWVTYINGDDLLRCRGVLRLMARQADADVLYGPVDFVTADGSFIHCWHSAAPGSLLSLFHAGVSPLLQQGTLFRRKVFDELGGFDPKWRYVADADFWWRALGRGMRFVRIAYPPVAAFRMHRRQQTQMHAAEMRKEHLAMVRSHGMGCDMPTRYARVLRYRATNFRSYLERCLRHPDLTGKHGFWGSYDVAEAAS